MTPSSLELTAVYSIGVVAAVNVAVVGAAIVRAVRRRVVRWRGRTLRLDAAHHPALRHPYRVRSLLLLVGMAGLVASAFELERGPRPGWRASCLGWRAGAFVAFVGDHPEAFGPGDPRIGLRSDSYFIGRSVVYLGSKGGW
jgi:hypothetical protein